MENEKKENNIDVSIRNKVWTEFLNSAKDLENIINNFSGSEITKRLEKSKSLEEYININKSISIQMSIKQFATAHNQPKLLFLSVHLSA